MRLNGTLRDWRDEKGFGFIEPEDGSNRVFVHIKAFGSVSQRPANGLRVSYLAGNDSHGRPCAVKVAFEGERHVTSARPQARTRTTPGTRSQGMWPSWFAMLFVTLLIGGTLTGQWPLGVLGGYAGASALSIVLYMHDKSSARAGRWRTKESTLHLLALVGGWPGALLAQRALRHKTSKHSFQIMFWITVVLNCGALVWLITPHGNAVLRNLLQSF